MPKTLLLADDSVTIQKVVGISFANEDIVLLTVDNGDEAIVRARDARPDIILADVVMPGKNGYDVCQTIKSDPTLAHIPVLLLTGTFEAFDEQRAAKVGADGHITKPFEAQSLVDKVNALLARPATGAGAAALEPAAERPELPIGTLRAASAPPSQPVSHTADTAYDFFDEEVTAPRGAETPEARPGFDRAPAPERPHEAPSVAPALPRSESPLPPRAASVGESGFGSEALDVDGGGFPGDSLFDDDFERPTPTARSAAAPARAVVPPPPSEPRGWGAQSEAEPSDPSDWDVRSDPESARGGDREAEGAGSATLDLAPSQPAAPSEPRGWDLAGDPAPPLRTEPEVSDWFSPSGSDPDGATTQLAVEDAARLDPRGSALSFDAPDTDREAFDLEAALDPESAFGGTAVDPRGARDYDVSSSDLGPSLGALVVTEPPALARPAPAAAPDSELRRAEPAARFASEPPARSGALPERERRELHDALEKLAWEAFGPVAESLVREAVERIERIAWEVIPQMAESLIKEELRKLKGD